MHSSSSYVGIVLAFRCLSGVILGFANMNILAVLTDIWGIDTGRCCRAGVYSPSELVMGDERRRAGRGGGLGAWLGLWAAVMVGGGSLGYCFGTIIDQSLHPSWPFWLVGVLGALLVVAVVLTPETLPTKRIVLGKGSDNHGLDSVRGPLSPGNTIERGELRLTVHGKAPIWWWQEVWAGWELMALMCSQIGFLLILSFTTWAFCTVCMVQQILYRILLGVYGVHPIDVAVCILAIPLGAATAIPIQLVIAQRGSRPPNGVHSFTGIRIPMATSIIRMSPHPSDRHKIHPYPFTYYLCTLVLVGSGAGFAAVSEVAMNVGGEECPWWILVVLSAAVGFGGSLALAEMVKILMEMWDLSGLEEVTSLSSRTAPISAGAQSASLRRIGRLDGPSGYAALQRSEGTSEEGGEEEQTMTTIYPHVAAGLAVLQGALMLFAATAMGLAVVTENENRGVGEGVTATVWVVVLLFVTAGLVVGLWRWREVEVRGGESMAVPPPVTRNRDVESIPVVRMGIVRTVCLLQDGRWTRWTESGRREFWGGGRRASQVRAVV